VVAVVVRRMRKKPMRWTSSSTTVTAMHDNINKFMLMEINAEQSLHLKSFKF